MKVIFESDQVKLKTGHRVDNSGEVTFMIGEYMLNNIKEFANVHDRIMKISVEIEE